MRKNTKSAPGGQETKKGFTLIELVVVMAIIAVLAALMVAALSAARKQATSTQMLGDIRTYEVALETYAAANGNKYPAIGGWAQVTATGSLASVLTTGTTKYLTSVPRTTTIFYTSLPITPLGASATQYTMIGCPAGTTQVNNLVGGTAPAAGATPCGLATDANRSAALYTSVR